MKKILLSFMIVLALPLAVQAKSGNVEELKTQIEELKRINEAQAQNLAGSLNQVQQMAAEFQKMSGRIEESQYFYKELDRVVKDNQRRLEAMESKNQLLVQQLEELKSTGLLPVTAVKKLDEFKQLQAGLSKVNADNFKDAITSFKAFITQNPKSPYAANAQYWIGESYYAMRDFPAAIAEFQNVIQKYPKETTKTASALLKQGMSFFEMQSFDEAKAFLMKLISKFPGTSEAATAQEKLTAIDRLMEQRKKEQLQLNQAI